MNPIAQHLARFACTALLIAGIAPGARAQADDDPEEIAPQAQPQPAFTINEVNFNQWAFGGRGDANTIRQRLDSVLTLKVEEVERACSLTEAQSKKLRLAGRGDIKRFSDRVDE